ncbi:hypothetical protein FRC07_009562, partial [Ceratobasidium sp. 392]
WALRIWAAFVLVSGALSLIFMKPRLPLIRPPTAQNISLLTRIKRQHWSFLYSPLFIAISITTFIQSLAYFPVALYMSVYTSSLGLPPLNGTIVLAVFNLASVIGQILFGHLCDIAPYPYVIILSGTGASLSAYLLWGFAHNLGLIFAFVVVFGSLSGGFSSIWPAACSDVVGPDHQAIVSNVFGVFGMIKGLAAVIGPIIAAALHHPHDSAVRTVYSGYGFRDVTLFVGSMMAATAAGGVGAKYLTRRHLMNRPDSIELGALGLQQPPRAVPSVIPNNDEPNPTGNRLESLAYGLSENVTTTERQLPELAPMDRGFAAWSFVASAFVLETLVWGFGYTYGVFQEYFIRQKTFKGASEAAIGSIGTIAIAMYSFTGMIFIVAAQQWRHKIPMMMWTCLGVCCLSLLCASFATQAWHLILLQGVCFGIGGGGLYAPVFVYLPEWFSVRKSLACAIIFGGAGAGGMIYPIMINYLLETLGFRWTLRIWTGFVLVLSTVALLFMKPPRIKQQHWSFLYSPLFLSISITSFIQSLAYFPVSLYMPVYTSSLGLPPLNGTIVLAVFNLSSVISQMLLGHLCDIAPYPYVIIASGVGASLSAYLLWGFAHNLGLIFAFVIVFGSLSGGFTSIWPTACSDIVGPDHQAIMSNVLGMLSVVKGIAAVIGPVVAASLHNPHDSAVRTVYSGYGFKDVTLFVGSMMAATAAGG